MKQRSDFMARTISFNINEKLAILKIMIDISNHYIERLPNAFKVIQETIPLLKLPNDIIEVDNISVSEAQDIINAFKYDSLKRNFLKELLGKMLQFSDFGAFKRFEDEEDELDTEDIINEFKEDWSYIYQLLGDIILVGEKEYKDLFTIEMISWRYIHQYFEDWIVTDEKDKNCQEKKDNEISKAMTWEEQIYF